MTLLRLHHHLQRAQVVVCLGLILSPSYFKGIDGFVPPSTLTFPVAAFTQSCTTPFVVQKRTSSRSRANSEHETTTRRRISSRDTDQDDTTSKFDTSSFEQPVSSDQKTVTKLTNKNSLLVTITNRLSATVSHLTSKDLGARGEIYVIPQFILVVSILIGKLPFYAEVAPILFGPVLFSIGVLVMGLAITEMGGSFTAFPVPVPKEKGGDLIQSGIFSLVRHPVYAGNLCCFVGLSIMTESSMRLLLTAFYYIYVEIKSQQEEEEMLVLFGEEYSGYKQQVRGKFIPQRILNLFKSKSNVTSDDAWQ
eukprot:CAMPEP_0198249248 /NCGR_PEP_ID=MMETSP1447-20131203/823_1 /TAXON_ID=420782 /ORGANISM="Chaetoceros dichaeta, Strain CCMP1751" /LENGTH=306 /DNA_ID=CAMNT_0043933831 /DNA_START=37 /DNA_END=957 /DNA_ORIENTATION=-